MALAVGVLTACGGGDSTSVDTSSTQSKSVFAAGPISGFGSIIVNGVHYDERSASVRDDDDAPRASDELKLGMIAEIQASDYRLVDGVQVASASEIVFRSRIRGPVESVSSDSMVVLGQTIKVSADTVFEEELAGGLAAVAPGDLVKVYGMLDTATGEYSATRVEREDETEYYALRSAVDSYDSAAGLLVIGGATIDVSGVEVPEGLQEGSLVRVKLETTMAGAVWVATKVEFDRHKARDSDHSEVEGTITEFSSPESFSVDGIPVDASAASFPDGTDALAEGARVEVEGAIVQGVLVATKVELEGDDDHDGDSDDDSGFEVEGAVESVDTGAGSFVVRGVTIRHGDATRFTGGTAEDLAAGARVEVHAELAADGVALLATEVEFEN
jgi:hypothetical protein